MTVSILVRTKNEAKFIEQTLGLLRRQDFRPAPEIIVVDSGSTDGTLQIVRKRGDVRLVQIPSNEFTYGHSLNVGMNVASGEIVIVLSAHALPCAPSWLRSLVRHFVDPKVAGVYGRQLPTPDAWPPVKRDYLEFYGDRSRIQENPDDPRDHYFSNAAAAIRRQVWERNRFDENLPYCEDWDWARRALAADYRIVYDPDAAVYHSHNERLAAVYRRRSNEAAARNELYGLTRSTLFGWLRTWVEAVRLDVAFILRERSDLKWLLWTVIYRGFWAYGCYAPNVRGPKSLALRARGGERVSGGL